jgi:hypothetical protein
MRARFASSFSRNGMSEAATDTSWFGDTSMNSTRSGCTIVNSPPMRAETRSTVKWPLGVDGGVRLRDRVLLLLEGGEVDDLVGDAALLHAPVRGLDEAELVHARVRGERGDEADVRAFRRLDRAHPAVVRRVHVAHLEPGALAREAARAERRETAACA